MDRAAGQDIPVSERPQYPERPSGASEDVSQARLYVSPAAIKTLRSAPIELVRSPGPGRVIRAKRLFVEFRFHSVPFVSAGSPLRLGTAADNAYWSLSQDVSLGGVTESRVWSANLNFEKSLSSLEDRPLVLTAEEDELFGPIVAAEIVDEGSGYAEGDTGTIVGASEAVSGTYRIVNAGVEGLVAEPADVEPLPIGSFFVSDEPIATIPGGDQTGGGDGALTLAVTEIDPQGDGEIWVTVDYDIMSLSG